MMATPQMDADHLAALEALGRIYRTVLPADPCPRIVEPTVEVVAVERTET